MRRGAAGGMSNCPENSRSLLVFIPGGERNSWRLLNNPGAARAGPTVPVRGSGLYTRHGHKVRLSDAQHRHHLVTSPRPREPHGVGVAGHLVTLSPCHPVTRSPGHLVKYTFPATPRPPTAGRSDDRSAPRPACSPLQPWRGGCRRWCRRFQPPAGRPSPGGPGPFERGPAAPSLRDP